MFSVNSCCKAVPVAKQEMLHYNELKNYKICLNIMIQGILTHNTNSHKKKILSLK